MRLYLSKPYLWIPIAKEKTEVKLHFYVDGSKVQEIDVKLGGDECDFYTAMDVSPWLGQELEIRSGVSDVVLKGILCRDEKPGNMYPYRPRLHFAPEIGWSNDPNGLVYADGIYHLFYQWNPYGVTWGNMHWGHGVSCDLIHWEHREAAMVPDEYGTVYSGCGWADREGAAGYGKNALLFYYTAAGGRNQWSAEKGNLFTQRMRVSVDGGNTLQCVDGFLMEHVMEENRDPKVFYHRESGFYHMVLYLDEYLFCICRSDDLLHWEETQRISMKGMRECPDLFELPVVNREDEKKWVFWSADGFYVVGSFDGYIFTPETEVLEAYGTTLPYAAQTYAGVSDRVISIAWLRMNNDRGNYRGVMSLPTELSLKRQGLEYSIAFRPVRELEALRQPLEEWVNYLRLRGEPVEIIISWRPQEEGQTKLSVGKHSLVIDFVKESICLYESGEQTEWNKKFFRDGEQLDLQLIIDEEVIEFYGCGGTVYGAAEAEEGILNKELTMESTAEIGSMECFELRDEAHGEKCQSRVQNRK